MDRREAQAILDRELGGYHSKTRAELMDLLDRDEPFLKELPGFNGASYTMQVEVFWDDQPGGAIRVLGTIHDGGLRAWVPLASDFLVGAEGPLP
jgi:hypothetical protein